MSGPFILRSCWCGFTSLQVYTMINGLLSSKIMSLPSLDCFRITTCLLCFLYRYIIDRNIIGSKKLLCCWSTHTTPQTFSLLRLFLGGGATSIWDCVCIFVCLFLCLWHIKLVSRLRTEITKPLPRQIYYRQCCCWASPQLILLLEMKMTERAWN